MEDIESCSQNGSIKPNIQISDDNAPEPVTFSDNFDNIVSTPYVSAPSSPGDGPPHPYGRGFFYSAPASPIHHSLSSVSSTHLENAGGSFEFELSGEPAPSESMSSADELFLNGQIRPMKLSSHLQHPQDPSPLIDTVQNDVVDDCHQDHISSRGRAFQFQPRDRRRKARSMSPLRSNTAFKWLEESTEINEKLKAVDKQTTDDENENENETEATPSGSSSRSSSVGRSSKRWVFLKELLYRSKSEGRNSTNSNRNPRLWSTLSSGKKSLDSAVDESGMAKKAVNGVGVSRKGRSAHEVHYTRNRAQAEEMRKKTYLPYRQGLFGCLGFSSKSYGAVNGFARAFNPVSTR